jgi:hypothetical protein
MKIRTAAIGLAAILALSAGATEPKYAGFEVTRHDGTNCNPGKVVT